MNKIENYLKGIEKRLRFDFDCIRDSFKDSDVKGGKNENVLKKFIETHYSCKFVSTGVEIIDSRNNSSSEIDVCVCNEYQPFYDEPNQPLIAEGVDFVIQVKSIITSQEIPRIIKNCKSVKSLSRKLSEHDNMIWYNTEDAKYLVDRIPYLVIADSSQLSPETIIEKLIEGYIDLNYTEQPDAIFILNKGCIFNFKEGIGRTLIINNEKIRGFKYLDTGESTILQLFRYIYDFIPKVKRNYPPITNYFPNFIRF